jgi:uncharacterized protein (TIGR02466 family)
MEFDVTPVFPTLIGRFRVPDADAMNQDLQALILAEEEKYASLGRSNIGGWHSRTDFLNRRDPAVSALTTWLTWALRRMIDASAGANTFQGTLSVSAWATLCRAGAYHAPHSHPDSAWSGVYYVDPGAESSEQPLNGVLEFLDPRAGVEAVTAPGDPYGEPFRVRPQAGLLVVFPSWLYHWVHPYAGQTPRIAISFNAAPAPVAAANEPNAAVGSDPITFQTAQKGTAHVDAHPGSGALSFVQGMLVSRRVWGMAYSCRCEPAPRDPPPPRNRAGGPKRGPAGSPLLRRP